jgi:hypothetical protein
MLQSAWFDENQGRAFFLLVVVPAKRRKAVTRRGEAKRSTPERSAGVDGLPKRSIFTPRGEGGEVVIYSNATGSSIP